MIDPILQDHTLKLHIQGKGAILDKACTEYVRYQSDALVMKLGRFIWQMHLISAVLLTAMLWNESQHQQIVLWAIWMSLLAIVQAIICFYGALLANRETALDKWPLAFDISAILLAIGWAWFGLTLTPNDASDLRNFVGFIIGGAVLMLTGTQNLHFPVMSGTLLMIVSVRATRLFIDNEGVQGIASAIMLLIFLGIMLGLGWVLRGFTRRGFVLQWEKAQLAETLERQAVELKTARAEAESANLAKSRFLAQASHDLRQPIHAVGLQLASIANETLPPRAENVMARIGQSVESLSKLFNALLDVTLLDSRQIIPKSLPIDIGLLIQEIADEYQPAAQAENVELRPEAHKAFIQSDPLIIRRILQNLISNAICHSDGGDIFISSQNTKSGTMLIVRDTGRGVPKADQARIFEEFQRGDGAVAEGLGLGLAIVSRLTQLLNVKIEFSSIEKRGTTFGIGPFRAAQEPTGTFSRPSSEASTVKFDVAGRALIIDDDRATLEASAALLSNWGWEIDTRSSLSADEIIILPKPDIIISDYDLGFGQTGLKVIAAIQEAHGTVPALIVTGSSLPEARQAILDAGFIVLHKPVRPAQLRSAILSAIA